MKTVLQDSPQTLELGSVPQILLLSFCNRMACSTVRRCLEAVCANTSQYLLHPTNSDYLEISFSYLLFINFSQYFYTEKIVLKTLSITVDEREEFSIILVGDYFYIVHANALLLWKDKCFNKKIYIPRCEGHFLC